MTALCQQEIFVGEKVVIVVEIVRVANTAGADLEVFKN